MISVFITLSGVAAALNPLVAHHIGAQQPEQVGPPCGKACGRRWPAACWARWCCWPPGAGGVDDRPGGASGGLGRAILQGVAMGMPAALLYRALHAYSSAVSQTRPIMVISLLALALKQPCSAYLLIYGKFGFPALGGAGCGWATGVAFWFSLICLTGWTRWRASYRRYALWSAWAGRSGPPATRAAETGRADCTVVFCRSHRLYFGGAADRQSGAQVVASHQVVINFPACCT